MNIINSNYSNASFTGLKMNEKTVKELYETRVSARNKAKFAEQIKNLKGDYSMNSMEAGDYRLFSVTKTEDLAPKNIDTRGELYKHNIFFEAVENNKSEENNWDKFFKKVIKACVKSEK